MGPLNAAWLMLKSNVMKESDEEWENRMGIAPDPTQGPSAGNIQSGNVNFDDILAIEDPELRRVVLEMLGEQGHLPSGGTPTSEDVAVEGDMPVAPPPTEEPRPDVEEEV